jgi:lipopolysaccharide export LptBFGC system permease protein LptF
MRRLTKIALNFLVLVALSLLAVILVSVFPTVYSMYRGILCLIALLLIFWAIFIAIMELVELL